MLKLRVLPPAMGLLLFSALGLTSCDSPTGLGAASGAAGGALIGGLATNRVGGAVTGSALGALTGALIGSAVEHSDEGAYGPAPSGGYPEASKTERRGIVLSPYAPYHEIDVTGIPHGARVRDPSCNRLFINP